MDMMSKKILVVEDDQVLRDVLTEKLEQTGYETAAAEDGVQAMDMIRANRPDLILLDILMPRKSGMEVMEELKADSDLSTIPIIVISNSGQPVEIKRARELGARDFLVKAIFDPNEVLNKVSNVFAQDMRQPASAEEDVAPAIEMKKEEPVASIPTPPQTKKTDTSTAVVSDQIKVLVVEDDDFLRGLFDRKLMARGLSVNSTMNAGEAFDSLEKRQPDIIMLDLMLPGIDGFDILATLKKDKRFKDIPVIIISNLGQKKDIDKAFELGASDFLVKSSLTLDEIINRVLSVIDKKEQSGA